MVFINFGIDLYLCLFVKNLNMIGYIRKYTYNSDDKPQEIYKLHTEETGLETETQLPLSGNISSISIV